MPMLVSTNARSTSSPASWPKRSLTLLNRVEIAAQQRDGMLVASRAFQLAGQIFHEKTSVVSGGQRIRDGQSPVLLPAQPQRALEPSDPPTHLDPGQELFRTGPLDQVIVRTGIQGAQRIALCPCVR